MNSRGCNSKAGRNRSIWPRGVLQGGTESLCGYRSLKETAALENDSKFFSAVTGGQLVAARILPHDIGDPSQCLVPGLVTKLIVKALEPVDVGEDKRNLIPGSDVLVNAFLQHLLKATSVVQRGELVRNR